MNLNSNVESGLQFLSRIHVRPKLQDIEKILFPNGLSGNETVEVCGNLSSGKTLLLTQFIAKCILPVHYDGKFIGGLGVTVVFINTDHHFMILKLRDLIVKMLDENENINVNELIIDSIVEQSFNKLIILNCYTSIQYSITLQTLNDILLDKDEIGLVIIDSITSYYWEDKKNGGDWLLERYIENILKVIQKHTFMSKIPLIYSRLIRDNSVTNERGIITCVNESMLGKINYRIKLIRLDDDNKFICTIQSSKSDVKISYTIGANGIMWNNEKKRKLETLSVE